ncbi:MAG: hypothetical protein ACTSQI_11110 [Candidatus Helarchaeota archaeon]
MTSKKNAIFLEMWNKAKQLEEEGHSFFQSKEYHQAAVKHQQAANFFKKALKFIDDNNQETQKKTWGNYYIELANSHHSLATSFFYKGDKEQALIHFHLAAEEQKNCLKEYEALAEKVQYKYEINAIKISLYFYSAYENLCKAQISFLKEKYLEAVEYLRIAEIHSNLETEFIAEIGDLNRLKRAKARTFYYKGQISRAKALLAKQNSDRRTAKEEYLKAAKYFEAASKLLPEWKEYSDLVKKAKSMASAIRN